MNIERAKSFFPIVGLLVCLAGTAPLRAQNITATPTQIVFNTQAGVAPAPQTLTITSTGATGAPLTFTTSVSSAGWLTVTPNAGTTPQALSVAVNPAALSVGTYGGFVNLTSGGVTVAVPVTLNVTATSGAVVTSAVTATPTALSFTFPSGATLPQTQSLSIATSSAAVTTVTATPTTDNGGNWLSVNPTSIPLALNTPGTTSVSVTPTGLATGVHNAVIALSPPGTNGTTVPVTVTIGGTPALILTPSSLNFSYQTGTANPAQQNIQITSSTGSPISYTAAATTTTCGANWLVLTTSSGSTPGTLGVQINPTNLVAANCMGQITITAPGTNTPTQTVPVNLLVSNNPLLQVPSTGPTFNFLTGGSIPAAQSVQITSSSTPIAFTAAATPVTGGANFLTVTPGSGTTPQALSLGLNSSVLAGLAPGTYMQNVTITSPGAGNSPQSFPVTLVVSNVPVLTASQPSANFNFQIGHPAPQSQVLTLSSTGGPLNYSVSTTTTNCPGFLSATPPTGTTAVPPSQSGQLVVAVNTSGITTPITCNGTITVTVPGTTNTPLTIPVTLNANTTPLLNAGQQAVQVTAVAGSTTSTMVTIPLTSTDGTTALNFTATASTNPPGLTWLSITPNTGSTPNNLNLTINPTGLVAGVYQGSISITSTSPNVPAQTIPVTLTVASAAVAATPATLTFAQALNGPPPPSQTIQITGVPSGTTVGASATVLNGAGWLTATPGSTAGTVTVTANGASLSQGIYQGVVTVLVPGTTPNPLYVPVTLTVGNPQTLAITPNALIFTVQAGSPTIPNPQTVQLTSSGGSVPFTATFTPTTGGNFVTVTPASGTTPTALTIALDPAVVSTLAAGTYMGTVTISSTSVPNGNQVLNVTLTVTPPGAPTVGAVVNAASNQPGSIVPGELVSIYGTGIGPATPVNLLLLPNGNVATTLGNTSVSFDGIVAPLTYVSPNQINAIVPYEVAGRATTTVVVQRAGVNSPSISVRVTDTAPAIFSLTQTGTGQGAILNQDSTVNGTPTAAARGSVVQIFATGAGQLNPGGVTGMVTSPDGPTFPRPVGTVSVTIGGQPATVQFAGSAPGLVSGVLQVNAVVPQNAAVGSQPIVLTVGNNSSLGNITVAVR